jgi:hypothetical protein
MSGRFDACGLAHAVYGSHPFSGTAAGGEVKREQEPVDLCITQARYTQLHRLISNSQVRIEISIVSV